MKTIYYLTLVCIVYTCIVNGVRAPRGYERRKTALSNAASVSSNTTLQNTTLTAESSGSPSTNETDTSTHSSTSNNTNISTPSPTVKETLPPKSGSAGGKSSNKAGTAPIPKPQVLSTTPAGSGAETRSVIQSVNYYLGIVIYFLMLQL
ncbi:uncharacterized protein LOC143051128 [Mytilus galloprovincialis]|uniref:uncharacterized protein LOC143051128 n=1 Tax=Mytilus galloprovincialis TaxID=29158 RepID=UPI003F7B77F5